MKPDDGETSFCIPFLSCPPFSQALSGGSVICLSLLSSLVCLYSRRHLWHSSRFLTWLACLWPFISHFRDAHTFDSWTPGLLRPSTYFWLYSINHVRPSHPNLNRSISWPSAHYFLPSALLSNLPPLLLTHPRLLRFAVALAFGLPCIHMPASPTCLWPSQENILWHHAWCGFSFTARRSSMYI